jgi:hypothetical protein
MRLGSGMLIAGFVDRVTVPLTFISGKDSLMYLFRKRDDT